MVFFSNHDGMIYVTKQLKKWKFYYQVKYSEASFSWIYKLTVLFFQLAYLSKIRIYRHRQKKHGRLPAHLNPIYFFNFNISISYIFQCIFGSQTLV